MPGRALRYARRMRPLLIEPIPCLRDNYAYLVHEEGAEDAFVVDPSEAEPVAGALARHHLRLRGILATHHHQDHVGGIATLADQAEPALWVAGHAADRGRIPRQTIFLDAPAGAFVPAAVTVAGRSLLGMHIPGHTRAAVAWGLADAASAPADVFTGDTLFAAGCGRLFEGTPAEMWASLRSLTALPPPTRLWFGHEYTASNLRFAATVEPDNTAVGERLAQLPPRTTPTTVALELATNPFVRSPSVAELAARRAAKDRF
jgi:hydroxyacylglutathione hydrolase